jgi:hypothetical protein
MLFVVVPLLCVVLGAVVPRLRAPFVVKAAVVVVPFLVLATVTVIAWNTSWGHETGWYNDPDAEDVFPTKAAELLLETGLVLIGTMAGLAIGAILSGLRHDVGRA